MYLIGKNVAINDLYLSVVTGLQHIFLLQKMEKFLDCMINSLYINVSYCLVIYGVEILPVCINDCNFSESKF
jgi:hypothetical protein